ncbi:MAG: T9SS type A sorting domain-containing protein, partial [Bacteroidales bacterium]|nr:T9SS type A sorting domain-containing protein [Bacteroidales bacterium]
MRTFLFFCFLFFVSFSGFSQSLVILDTDENDVSNDTLRINVDPRVDPTAVHLKVINNNSDTLNVKVKKVENSIVDGTDISFCWTNCYGPTTFVSPTPLTIEPGDTNTSFIGDYYHLGIQGTTTVTFVFFDEANIVDSSIVVVVFQNGTVGVTKTFASSISTPYPNPCNREFNFNIDNNFTSGALKLYNITGKEVSCFSFSMLQNKVTIPTYNLKTGLYFYEFFEQNKLIK